MRCLSCSKPMTGIEIGRHKPDGTPEDLCTKCLSIAKGKRTNEEDRNTMDAITEFLGTQDE